MPKGGRTELSELVDTWLGLRWPGETSNLRAGPYPNSYIFDGYGGPEHFDVTTDNGKALLMRILIKCIKGLHTVEFEVALAEAGWEILLAGRRCTSADLVTGTLTLLVRYLEGDSVD